MGVSTPTRTARPMVQHAVAPGARGLALRLALAVTLAVAVARLHAVHDPGVLCPLRAVTGVPCPLCGSTSAFIALGSGEVMAALAAQPVTAAATVLAVAAPRAVAARWRRLSQQWRITLTVAIAFGSWVYQLHRFGVLG